MANMRYFADLADGSTLQFDRVDYRSSKDIRGYSHELKSWVKVTRKIEYKAMASKHVCDSRCMNATGRIMKCECACGGKNHGKGHFTCE